MKAGKALLFTTRLVALSGLSALLLSGESAYWLVVPATLAVFAGIVMPDRLNGLKLSARAVSVLVAAAFLFSIADFLYIGGSLIMAGSDFLVILLCLKLFSLNEEKDHVQVYALSLFLLLASSGLSTEIYFIISFVAFFLSLTWALILLTIKGEAAGPGQGMDRFTVGGRFFGGTALLTLAAFAATLLFFLILPRIGVGFFSRQAGGLLKIAGFSDTVRLGDMGEVKLDPTVVMRAEIPGAFVSPERPPYWRGRAFDLYDGTSWQDTAGGEVDVPRNIMGEFYISPGRRQPERPVVQVIDLEPLETSAIFALYRPYKVVSDFRHLWANQSLGLHLPYSPGSRIHYTVYSDPVEPSDEELAAEDTGLPSGQNDPDYLQLPEGSGRLTELAGQVTAGAASPFEKVKGVKNYLGTNFAYTLDPPRDTSLSPMDDFLFKSKAGYCEHFATAMTLMLRATGVPARMVSGFMGGEWNEYGGFYLVREQDAHTWVEVYFPDYGWVRFDPTPPAPAGAGASAVSTDIGKLLGYLRFKWDRYIVYYSLRDQVEAAGRLSKTYQALRRTIDGLAGSLKNAFDRRTGTGTSPGALKLPAVYAVIPVLFILLAYAAMRLLKKKGFIDKKVGVAFYEEMESILRKKGLKRAPGTTPLEFAAVVSDKGNIYEGVKYVTEVYNRVRFGGRPINPGERSRVKAALRRMKE